MNGNFVHISSVSDSPLKTRTNAAYVLMHALPRTIRQLYVLKKLNRLVDEIIDLFLSVFWVLFPKQEYGLQR